MYSVSISFPVSDFVTIHSISMYTLFNVKESLTLLSLAKEKCVIYCHLREIADLDFCLA